MSESHNSPQPTRNIIAVLAFILFLNIFLLHADGPVRFALEILGLFVFLIIIFLRKYHLRSQLPLIIGSGIALAFTLSAHITRSYWLIESLTSVLTWGIILSLIYLLAAHLNFFRALTEVIAMPFRVFLSYFSSWFGSIAALFSTKQEEQSIEKSSHYSEKVKKLVFGLVISLPILFILVSMLASGDAIFANYVKAIFNQDILNNLPERLFYSAFLFIALIPFIHFVQTRTFVSPTSKLLKFHFTNELTIVMSLVALVLATFLVIQWPYIFASVSFEADLSQYGVATYSEYVRKGFIELLKVSIFLYGLIWIGLIALRGKKAQEKPLLSVVQMIVIAELAIFIISIFRRIWLYQEFHGWSLVRIYGGAFLVWLLGITAILALRHFIKRNWVLAEVIFSVLFIIAISSFNAERFITLHHPPTVNKRIDYTYLSRMSPDGYEGWRQSYDHVQEVLNNRNYQTKDLLDKDDRREIAYAGMTITHLLRNYEKLVVKHGTEDERKEYFDKSMENLLTYLRLEDEDRNKRIGSGSATALDLNQNLKFDIEQLDKAIKQDEGMRNQVAMKLSISTDPQLYNFQLAYPKSFYSFYGNYSYETQRRRFTQTFDDFDRKLMWNASQVETYQLMKNEMPHAELLKLADMYMELAMKISKQPINERTYEMDISTDTPLLESF